MAVSVLGCATPSPGGDSTNVNFIVERVHRSGFDNLE